MVVVVSHKVCCVVRMWSGWVLLSLVVVSSGFACSQLVGVVVVQDRSRHGPRYRAFVLRSVAVLVVLVVVVGVVVRVILVVVAG